MTYLHGKNSQRYPRCVHVSERVYCPTCLTPYSIHAGKIEGNFNNQQFLKRSTFNIKFCYVLIDVYVKKV